MICAVCEKEVGAFSMVDLENVRVHISCFFDASIPNAPSRTSVHFEELKAKREKAIEKRISEIKKLK